MPAHPPERTLEDMRTELIARCGFQAAGSAAGVITANMNSFLQNAQRVLYELHDWTRLRRYVDENLGVGQFRLDYPENSDPDRILGISIEDPNGPVATPYLSRGILPAAYSYRTNRRRPARWDAFEQIEFDAEADKVYTVRTFYLIAPTRFTENSDRASVRSSLVFIHALADAKAHYRQPDAASYAAQRDAVLVKLKSRNWARSVFNPRDSAEEEMLAKPVVV